MITHAAMPQTLPVRLIPTPEAACHLSHTLSPDASIAHDHLVTGLNKVGNAHLDGRGESSDVM
jgi:hypothetical protein